MFLTDDEFEELQNMEFSQNDWLWFYTQAVENKLLEKLKAQEPDAWQIRNGLCHAGIRGNQLAAELTAANMQKCHDLGGSLAAFNVRPLYAHPLPPDDVVRDAARYKWLRDEINEMSEIRVINSTWEHLDAAIDAAMKEMK